MRTVRMGNGNNIRRSEIKMNPMGIAIAAAAVALFGNLAVAQTSDEITVQGTRVMSTKSAGRTSTGVPILDVSLSYGVSTAGLDLASHVGALELEKRVHGAAVAACKEIGRKYPNATPSEEDCAKAAADKAMVRVHELEAAAAAK